MVLSQLDGSMLDGSIERRPSVYPLSVGLITGGLQWLTVPL